MSLQMSSFNKWLKAQTSCQKQTNECFSEMKPWLNNFIFWFSVFESKCIFLVAFFLSATAIWIHLQLSCKSLSSGTKMSSSYAAAISALLTASALNPPIKPSPHPSPDTARDRKPLPPSSKSALCPPAAQIHSPPPDPLGSYEEQQENPADYCIGRQRSNITLQLTGSDLLFDAGSTLFCRWLLSCRDRRDFCWPLPSGKKVGMGSLLYCVALLGYGVSTCLTFCLT